MKSLILLFLVIAVCLLAFTSVGQQATQPSPQFLDAVRVGQSVALKGAFYEITVLGDGSIGQYKIVAVQSDYVDLVDLSGVQQVRVPTHAIRSITHIKVDVAK